MSVYSYLAPFYDALTGDVDYEAFADYYEKIFADCGLTVRTILDLACGTGTLTWLLANRGYEMIGVDGSEDMLMMASEKACDDPGTCVQPMFLNQQMEELDLYGTVDAEICCLDGINYAQPENLREIFHRLWLFLEPGGVLIFDINSPHKLQSLDGQVFIDEQEDVYCVWRAQLDEEEAACIYGMDIFSDNGDGTWTRDLEEHIEYIYMPEQLKKYLEAENFEDVRIYGHLQMTPPAADEQRIFLTARKPKQTAQE